MRKTSLIAVTLALGTSPLMWADIEVEPASPSVTVGQSFNLNVMISGAADLYGWQFDVGFNPAVLQATSVSEGPFLSSGGPTIFLPGTIDNVGGSISNNADILNGAVSGVNGGGDLLDVRFNAIAAGSSTVQVFNLTAIDSFGLGLDETTFSSTVSVAPSANLPEPGGWSMIGIGLVGLVWARRCRRRASSPTRGAQFSQT